MPVGDGCSPNGASIAASSQFPVVASTDQIKTLNRVPDGPQLMGACEYTSGGTLLAGFQQRIILVSGPGPTYTNEVILGSLDGQVAVGSVSRGFWSLTQNMPVAGRPFDWTRDGFRITNNTGFTGVSAGAPMTLSWIGCSSASAVVDCCAELNGKLDQVLAAVAKIYVNQP